MGIGKSHRIIKQSKTQNQNQQHQTKKVMPFVKVHNDIIIYSAQYNRSILPIYLYASINSNVYYHNQCTFSLPLLLSYYTSLQKRTRNSAMFKDGIMKLLYGDEDKEITIIGSFLPLHQKEELDLYDPNFDINAAITVRVGDKETKEEIDSGNIRNINSWTPMYIDEYYYIVDTIKQKNLSVTGKDRLNLIDLLNTYMFLKMKINACEMMAQKRNCDIPFILNLNKCEKALGVGKKTVVKYINQLRALGLIEILSQPQYQAIVDARDVMNVNRKDCVISYGYKPKENNVIMLSDEWRTKNYEYK